MKKRVFTEFLFIWLERTTLRYAFLLFFYSFLGDFWGLLVSMFVYMFFYFLWFLLKISLVLVSFSSLIYLYSCFDSCWMLICLHSPSSGPIISNMRCGLDEFVLSIPIVFCFSPFSPVPSTLPECIIFSSVSKEGKQSSRRDFLGGWQRFIVKGTIQR